MSRPITDIIREINKGAFAEEITRELANLVPACRAAGAPGAITITLKLKPGKRGSNVVEVVPSFKVAAPKSEVPTEIFFATNGGALVRDNPDQQKLDLQLVEAAPVTLVVTRPGQVPLRELMDPTTGEVVRVPMPTTGDAPPAAPAIITAA